MTVTLYHGGGSCWEKTVLTDVWARWSRGSARDAAIPRDDDGSSLLLIPWREDLTISLGDGVWDGAGPDLLPGPLKAQLPEVQIVIGVDLHRPGSPLDHWEVKAR